MNETLLDCFDKKAKIRFIELNTVMTDALRDEVLKDTGHPKLRSKCLDLITKMRLEAQILNPSKTARIPSPKSPPPAIPNKLANTASDAPVEKEKLCLDENG